MAPRIMAQTRQEKSIGNFVLTGVPFRSADHSMKSLNTLMSGKSLSCLIRDL